MRTQRLLFLWFWTVISACGPPTAQDEIVVGLIVPIERSPQAASGAQLAVEEINAAGGLRVGDRRARIRLLVEDSVAGPETAVSKALKLINRDRAVVLLGVPRSNNAIPVAKLAERARIPLISTMSTHTETTADKRFAFRLAFLNEAQGRALARFAYDDLNARRAASLVHSAGVYSVELAAAFEREFERLGGRIVARETFTEDRLEVAEELRRIQASGAEVLFLPNHTSTVGAHLREARALGLEVTCLGGDTWNNQLDYRDLQAAGSYFSDFWAPDQPQEETGSFVAAFRQRYGEMPPTSAALSYDAVSILATAVQRQGKADPESIRAGLASIEDFQGVTGRIFFSGSGDPARSVFIRKIEEDGQIRVFKEFAP